jgi:hypothetical protein
LKTPEIGQKKPIHDMFYKKSDKNQEALILSGDEEESGLVYDDKGKP